MDDKKRRAIRALLIDTDIPIDQIGSKFGHTGKWVYDHFPGGRLNPEIAEARAAKEKE